MTLAILHNLLFYSTATFQNKVSSMPLGKRRDVIMKAVFRSLRRYYLKEFKKDNKPLVRKRFAQVTASAIFNGFIKTCRRIFGEIPNLNEIAEFLMIVSSIKPMNSYPFTKSIQTKADLVNSVMYKFSRKMLSKIFKFKELGISFKYVYENHPEFLSKSFENKDNEDKELCTQILNELMEQFSLSSV